MFITAACHPRLTLRDLLDAARLALGGVLFAAAIFALCFIFAGLGA